jgi:hypothetical protein
MMSLQPYASTDRNWSYFSLKTRNELGALSIKEVKFLRRFAQGGVVLLNEIPSNLVL